MNIITLLQSRCQELKYTSATAAIATNVYMLRSYVKVKGTILRVEAAAYHLVTKTGLVRMPFKPPWY